MCRDRSPTKAAALPTSTSTTPPRSENIPSNTFLDLAFGIENEKYAIELFVANATDEDAPLFFDAECAPGVCGDQTYGVVPRPRTFGIRFKQDF